jgi:hypothetical protein
MRRLDAALFCEFGMLGDTAKQSGIEPRTP